MLEVVVVEGTGNLSVHYLGQPSASDAFVVPLFRSGLLPKAGLPITRSNFGFDAPIARANVAYPVLASNSCGRKYVLLIFRQSHGGIDP